MENPDNLPAVPRTRGRFLSVRQQTTIIYERTTNPASLISGLIMLADLFLLGYGLCRYTFGPDDFLQVFHQVFHDHQFYDDQVFHNPQIVALYFLSSFALMLIYGFFYGDRAMAQHSKHGSFSTGTISPRWVLRSIAYLTSLSFMAAGYVNLSLGWESQGGDGLLWLIAVPANCLFFAWIYGIHCQREVDMLPTGSRRGTAGRRTILILTLMSIVSTLYYFAVELSKADYVLVWGAVVFIVATVLTCIVVYGKFRTSVTMAQDRGVIPS